MTSLWITEQDIASIDGFITVITTSFDPNFPVTRLYVSASQSEQEVEDINYIPLKVLIFFDKVLEMYPMIRPFYCYDKLCISYYILNRNKRNSLVDRLIPMMLIGKSSATVDVNKLYWLKKQNIPNIYTQVLIDLFQHCTDLKQIDDKNMYYDIISVCQNSLYIYDYHLEDRYAVKMIKKNNKIKNIFVKTRYLKNHIAIIIEDILETNMCIDNIYYTDDMFNNIYIMYDYHMHKLHKF